MSKNYHRERLINAIIFFSQQTNRCHKVKLWKLLHFLDFEHYKEIGQSVTGLNYYAWPKGPVPKTLHDEIDNNDQIDERLDLSKESRNGYQVLHITPKVEFDASKFTPRQLRIMEGLAEEFKDSEASEMIEATHFENQPWHQIFEVEKNKQGLIPYSLAIRSAEEAEMLDLIKDNEEFNNNYL